MSHHDVLEMNSTDCSIEYASVFGISQSCYWWLHRQYRHVTNFRGQPMAHMSCLIHHLVTVPHNFELARGGWNTVVWLHASPNGAWPGRLRVDVEPRGCWRPYTFHLRTAVRLSHSFLVNVPMMTPARHWQWLPDPSDDIKCPFRPIPHPQPQLCPVPSRKVGYPSCLSGTKFLQKKGLKH
jgi:hypothetical protein